MGGMGRGRRSTDLKRIFVLPARLLRADDEKFVSTTGLCNENAHLRMYLLIFIIFILAPIFHFPSSVSSLKSF